MNKVKQVLDAAHNQRLSAFPGEQPLYMESKDAPALPQNQEPPEVARARQDLAAQKKRVRFADGNNREQM